MIPTETYGFKKAVKNSMFNFQTRQFPTSWDQLYSPWGLSVIISNVECCDLANGIPYFAFVVSMAKQLGLNTEIGLARLTRDRQEKEDCRNLWWIIHRLDQLILTLNRSKLGEEDNGIYLPGTAQPRRNGDDLGSLGLEIMKSKKSFTPHITSQNIFVNRVLLDRLFGQAIKLHEQFKKDQSIDTLFALHSLKDSLFLWYVNLPQSFTRHLQFSQIDSFDSLQHWTVYDIMFQYHFARIKVQSPIVYASIAENPSAIFDISFNSLYYDCEKIAELFQFYLERNPNLEFVSIFHLNYTFHALIPPILLSHVQDSSTMVSNNPNVLAVLLTAAQTIVKQYNLGLPIQALLDRFLQLNAVQIIREYEQFSFENYLK
ncbi:hypothetical protein HDV01_004528 [Terramyces sp. JEL0728]|nr:hypothetical protein HDV01_004528 [Terramyces sp. JEL0728]